MTTLDPYPLIARGPRCSRRSDHNSSILSSYRSWTPHHTHDTPHTPHTLMPSLPRSQPSPPCSSPAGLAPKPSEHAPLRVPQTQSPATSCVLGLLQGSHCPCAPHWSCLQRQGCSRRPLQAGGASQGGERNVDIVSKGRGRGSRSGRNSKRRSGRLSPGCAHVSLPAVRKQEQARSCMERTYLWGRGRKCLRFASILLQLDMSRYETVLYHSWAMRWV